MGDSHKFKGNPPPSALSLVVGFLGLVFDFFFLFGFVVTNIQTNPTNPGLVTLELKENIQEWL